MATFAAAAGAPLPSSGGGEDSFNQLPQWLGKADAQARPFEVHHSGSGYFAIRQGAWKLIPVLGTVGSRVAFPTSKPETMERATRERNRQAGTPLGELYNLEQDPGERENLYDRHPERVYEMIMLLEQCRRLERTIP